MSTKVQEAIEFLEERGYVVKKPLSSIKEVLEGIDEPKPSARTLKRAAKKGLFEAVKSGFSGRGYWLIDIHDPHFVQWLTHWQNARRSLDLLVGFADGATDKGRNDPAA